MRLMSTVQPKVSSWDMLARLAVFYLAAEPFREGMLVRERSGFYTQQTVAREPKPKSTSREDLRAWVMQRREKRLAEVGGDEALLRSRRADAVWLDITDPKQPRIEAHEIKVSRADLVAELRRPEKSAVWMQQSHRFWLTLPDPALIDGLVLPESWGVLAVPTGSAPVMVRPAPALIPRQPIRRDLAAYVRREAQTRFRSDGDRLRAFTGRYTVASRIGRDPGP